MRNYIWTQDTMVCIVKENVYSAEPSQAEPRFAILFGGASGRVNAFFYKHDRWKRRKNANRRNESSLRNNGIREIPSHRFDSVRNKGISGSQGEYAKQKKKLRNGIASIQDLPLKFARCFWFSCGGQKNNSISLYIAFSLLHSHSRSLLCFARRTASKKNRINLSWWIFFEILASYFVCPSRLWR